jgi:putative transposase
LRQLAPVRRRFGYRRLGYLLAREGITPNQTKLLCIYRVRRKRALRARGDDDPAGAESAL